MTANASIACIGVIGKHDNPLHIAVFQPHQSDSSAYLNFSLLLNSSLDFFEERARDKNRVDQDLGCLQHVDERLSIYGWETGTGARFAIIVDAWGREGRSDGPARESSQRVMKDGDVKSAFKALQSAYIRLLQNPFYTPSDQAPLTAASGGKAKNGKITSQKFVKEVERIGNTWRPGLSAV